MNNQPKSKTKLAGTGPETPGFAKKTGGEVLFLPQGVPVLGVGASAGGLDAFKLLLGHLPVDSGFAFVLVQHLEPTHRSMLTEILGRVTRMPVVEAADGTAVEPNHVYVIPPNRELRIFHRELKVTQRRDAGPHLPIDAFLRSLADDCGSSAMGAILSGAGTDGSAGLQAVKEAGGITFAQDPHTAEFPNMPTMASQATNVDFVLSPEGIAAEVARIARHPFFAPARQAELEEAPEDRFGGVFAVMRDTTGIDFSLYREKTVHRRILRRLALCNTGSLEEYTRLLESDRSERSALQRDLLIGVTSFFRDPASFESLKKVAFPQIVENRPAGATIRIWVAGCATGEEAYSIAIALQEFLSDTATDFAVQIFASDISDAGIEKARTGKYPDTIAANVNTDRLDRYFTKVDGGYQVAKSIREMCVFSRHNLINDPPFSRLDLITCRNVLIYLGIVQSHIISLFHYALKSDGFLMLGASEGRFNDDLFSVADEEHRIYSKKGSKRKRYPIIVHTSSRRGVQGGEKASWTRVSEVWDGADPAKEVDVVREVDRVLLSRYSPAGVVVDEDLDVIEVRGPITPYLKLPSGKLSFRLFTLVPDTGFFLELEKLIQTVKDSGEPGRKKCLHYEHDGSAGEVNVEVLPLESSHRRAFLVLFESAEGVAGQGAEQGAETPIDPHVDDGERQTARLKRELLAVRQRLLSMFEEHETSENKSRNATQEALSNNEELQSLNEELETAKEELQSTNEELITVNQELQSKNADLAKASHFTTSIVETVRQPLLVLDTDFRVKSANQSFYRAFALPTHSAEGQLFFSLCRGSWNIRALRDVLDRVLPGDSSFHDFQVGEDFAGVGRRDLVLSGCRLDGLNLILLAIEDVTERNRAENALRQAQDNLRQAQKMEAIGRLAGGVAHDFNNMLTAILGYASLILESSTDQFAIGATQQIRSAGERAAALTTQLLAFSRRQALQPKMLDLNGILADLDRLLRHLLGDHIQVTINAATGLWSVKADPGEIGRAVMNLCLNARDAMPGGGTLTIRTANVMPDEGAEQNLAGCRYVELAVADTGMGMDSAVKDHIFEPFFTTKEFGKGTGLGLASVLGIVEQSGGAIRCDSEVGQGTTFRIFLPAMAEAFQPVELARAGLALAPKGSSEVILLVEDEDIVRTLARTILVSSGYDVLEAHDGGEALAMCDSHEGAIDLLLSDVMMPVLGGRELAERAAIGRPGMKVLFMSGHTPDAILREGIGKGIAFLPKPFRPADLVYKVREVLDSPARSQAQSGG